MGVDVIVIGSGQAGVPLATRLAAAGKQVLLVERAALGGTCVNYGCTPTKTMVASARAAHVVRTAGRLGIRVKDVQVDFAAVVARKEAVVRRWRESVERRLRNAGERLKLVKGHARFVGEREIEVNGERHRGEVVIIDTGARPAVPNVAGLESVAWLDNRRLMELRSLPRHLVVLGGGYIGCEFGQMFRRFGSEVTVVNSGAHLLGREDLDISAEVEKVFRTEGIRLLSEARAQSVSPAGEEIALRLESGESVRGTHLLVAVGRRPNTDDLGCEAAGIRLDRAGTIAVDDSYQTSAPGVYAVGDVAGGPRFTHSSWDDHRILFNLLLGRSKRGRSDRLIPYTVFIDPQLAAVGLNERDAKSGGISYEVATLPFNSVARAVEVDEPAGLMKVLVDPKTERVLGAAIVGAEAGELIHIFVTLMEAQASARAIVDAEFVHPTFAEGVQSLVMKLERFAL